MFTVNCEPFLFFFFNKLFLLCDGFLPCSPRHVTDRTPLEPGVTELSNRPSQIKCDTTVCRNEKCDGNQAFQKSQTKTFKRLLSSPHTHTHTHLTGNRQEVRPQHDRRRSSFLSSNEIVGLLFYFYFFISKMRNCLII